MTLNKTTAALLALVLVVIFGLTGWGHLLALDPAALSAVKTAASVLGAILLAAVGSILRKDTDGDGVPDFLQGLLSKFLGVVVLCGALTAGMWLGGCGASAVQSALSAQAEVIRATQPARFDGYRDLHIVCVARTRPDLDAYRVCMRPAEAVARASDSYRHTLEGAQHTLDVVGSDADVPRIAACVIESARDYLNAAESAGAPVPDDVRSFANMIPEGICHAE